MALQCNQRAHRPSMNSKSSLTFYMRRLRDTFWVRSYQVILVVASLGSQLWEVGERKHDGLAWCQWWQRCCGLGALCHRDTTYVHTPNDSSPSVYWKIVKFCFKPKAYIPGFVPLSFEQDIYIYIQVVSKQGHEQLRQNRDTVWLAVLWNFLLNNHHLNSNWQVTKMFIEHARVWSQCLNGNYIWITNYKLTQWILGGILLSYFFT